MLQFGGWPFMGMEDIAVVLGVTERNGGVVLPDAVLGYRRHPGQVSRSEDAVSVRVAESRAVFDLVQN